MPVPSTQLYDAIGVTYGLTRRTDRRIAAQNLTLLTRFFAEHDDLFDWHRPDGGVVGYPRYRHAEGVEAFCRRLLAQHGVMLLPASVYRSQLSPTPPDRFRIGFGRQDFAAGLEAMGAALENPGAKALCIN